jgi:FlaA1/EpsC-like NDP-sugar epimerase
MSRDHERILIVGAGDAGRTLLSEFRRRGLESRVAGFADDDPAKIGTTIDGVPVLASALGAGSILAGAGITEAIISMPSSKSVSRIVGQLVKADQSLSVRILPHVTRYFEDPQIGELQDISFSDIMERDEVVLDVDAMNRACAGRTVLVTGAGGSIGGEICRNLIRFRAATIIALGRGENSIYQLARAIGPYAAERGTRMIYRICDVRNNELLARIFDAYRPECVFHAAAHKHVPMMEFNEAEAFANNVGGTLNLLDRCASSECGFVLVSTDKAVEPTSVMGLSKRLAEIAVLLKSREGIAASAVRFGNVLGSRGSVIQLFRDQIRRGGPVTVTHPDIRRYFMSIPEAALLVINASAYSSGGDIFMLEMGGEIGIMDVARRMIDLHGMAGKIEIALTGLRPGEKLSESLRYQWEQVTDTPNASIKRIAPYAQSLPDCAEFLELSRSDMAFSIPHDELRKRMAAAAGIDAFPERSGDETNIV